MPRFASSSALLVLLAGIATARAQEVDPSRALPGPGRSLTLAEEGTATPLADARDGGQDPAEVALDEDPFAGAPLTKETYPLERVRRPLSLVPGMIEIATSFGVGLSTGVAGEELSLRVDGSYGLGPFFQLGATLGTSDVRSFGDFAHGGIFARRQLLNWMSARGDLLLLREVSFKTEPGPSGDPEETKTSRARFAVAGGLPMRTLLGDRVALEGLDRLLTFRSAPRAVGVALPLALLWQMASFFAAEVTVAPEWRDLDEPRLELPVGLGMTIGFSNSTELEASFRLLDTRELFEGEAQASVRGRELLFSLRLRM